MAEDSIIRPVIDKEVRLSDCWCNLLVNLRSLLTFIQILAITTRMQKRAG